MFGLLTRGVDFARGNIGKDRPKRAIQNSTSDAWRSTATRQMHLARRSNEAVRIDYSRALASSTRSKLRRE